MKKFIYVDEDDEPLLVKAKEKPSQKTIPECGTWIIREFTVSCWYIPPFPEITWGALRKLRFVGEIKK